MSPKKRDRVPVVGASLKARQRSPFYSELANVYGDEGARMIEAWAAACASVDVREARVLMFALLSLSTLAEFSPARERWLTAEKYMVENWPGDVHADRYDLQRQKRVDGWRLAQVEDRDPTSGKPCRTSTLYW